MVSIDELKNLTEIQLYHFGYDCIVSVSDTGIGCNIVFSDMEDIYCSYDKKSKKLTINNMSTNGFYELSIPKCQIRPLIALYCTILINKYGMNTSLVLQFDKDDKLIKLPSRLMYGFTDIKFTKKDFDEQTIICNYIKDVCEAKKQNIHVCPVIKEFKDGEGFLFFTDFLGGKLV